MIYTLTLLVIYLLLEAAYPALGHTYDVMVWLFGLLLMFGSLIEKQGVRTHEREMKQLEFTDAEEVKPDPAKTASG